VAALLRILKTIQSTAMATPNDYASDIEECQSMQKEEFEVLEVPVKHFLVQEVSYTV